MDRDRIARLTDKQRACLRLVYAHMSSKEIAPKLGVEPGTVDQYVKAAMRILGVSDRRAAAKMLAEHEGPARQPLVYQPLDIAETAETATLAASTGGMRQAAFGGAVRDERAVIRAYPPPSPDALKLPLPIGGRRPSDLGALKRLGWILAIILLITLAFGSFVTAFEALSRLGRS